MPRKRLRPEYPQQNYTYHCLIEGEPPQVLWDTARGMQTLWNRLIDLHEQLRLPWKDQEPPTDAKRQAYKDLLGTHGLVYNTCRDDGLALGLSAWPKWHVHDTFQAAMVAWSKHQREAPKKHHGLKTILLPHRTDSGGVSLDWLWRDTPQKHTAILPPDPGHHHRRAYMQIGGVRVPLLVLMHRPVPADAIVKRIALLGTFEPSLRRPGNSGWFWRLQLTVELPPREKLPPTGRVAGIDVGWRVGAEGLRIAVLSDGQGHYWELALPWHMENRNTTRRQALYQRHGATLDTTGSWRQLWTWRTAIDEQLEACKQALHDVDHTHWPAEAQGMWTGHLKMRAGGLRRLRRALWQAGDIIQPLEEWHAWHSTQMRRYRGSELRLTRARNSLYRLVTDWIARHFDVVSIEGDLDLQELAEKPTKTRKKRGKEGKTDALSDSQRRERRANKNRQLASISTFRLYLTEAIAKYGRLLYEAPAAYTSRTCRTCGTRLTESADVWRVCPLGHGQDRDCAAADLLVLAIPDDRRPGSTSVPAIDRMQLLPVLHTLIPMSTPEGWSAIEALDDILDPTLPSGLLSTAASA
jgi:hypothetical protein